MYSCIIVDDEPLARKVLADHIAAIPDLEIKHQCKSALEAQKYLEQHPVDIIFLDINMPRLKGIDLVRHLEDPPLVIFTTAYSEYAVEAFEVQAFDYLVKPISFSRLLASFQKAKKQLQRPVTGSASITIKEGKRLYRLALEDITYLQAYGDYVRIFTREQTFITKERLSVFQQQLDQRFVQVHRSYVVNFDQVSYLEGNHLKLDEAEIPVSASYRDAVLAKLG